MNLCSHSLKFLCFFFFVAVYKTLGSRHFESITGVSSSMLDPSKWPLTHTGTTIVGFRCIDGVVLGADTRCTGGQLIVDKDKLKINRLSSRVYCAGAGKPLYLFVY